MNRRSRFRHARRARRSATTASAAAPASAWSPLGISPRSSAASSSISSIRPRMPSTSISICATSVSRSASVCGRPSVSASPRIRASGVRNSCETAAENSRRASRKSPAAVTSTSTARAPSAWARRCTSQRRRTGCSTAISRSTTVAAPARTSSITGVSAGGISPSGKAASGGRVRALDAAGAVELDDGRRRRLEQRLERRHGRLAAPRAARARRSRPGAPRPPALASHEDDPDRERRRAARRLRGGSPPARIRSARWSSRISPVLHQAVSGAFPSRYQQAGTVEACLACS